MIKSKKTGQVIVISSPSGGGKGTVISELLKRNKNLWLSVSTTSRPIRANDIPGTTYNFVSKEEFEKEIEEGYFLEYTNYVGNYYGTPKGPIKEKLDQGIDVILEIEIEGASNIKKLLPESIFIFIMPPSIKTLVKRLKKRNTDSNDKLLERFHKTYKEINEVTKYNYVVVNDILEDTIDKVEAIIKAEKCRVDRIEEVYLDTKEEEIHELLMEEDYDNSTITEKI
ncbi:guanylate kinase [Mycoplasma sp. CAG:877]|nr:guanylate kinase [Mycoplasma sp. CAG:877]